MNRNCSVIYTIVIFALLSINLDALTQPKNFFVNNISVEQGLPGENVRVILEDSKGFMWFGIDDIGLCRYDGNKFILYNNNPNDSLSISNNFIRAIYEDSKGTLWIGTDYGLNKFDAENRVFRIFLHNSNNKQSISSNKVSGIYEDSKGNLWIGTGKGADILDRETEEFSHLLYQDSVTGSAMLDEVFSFYENNDTLWIGSKKGLFEYPYMTETLLRHKLSSNPVLNDKINLREIVMDRYNRFWMASDFGLFTYDLKSRESIQFQFSEPNPTLSCMTIDLNGRIWVGGFTSGIKVIDPVRMDYISIDVDLNNKRSIRSEYIIGLYTDKKGLVWIGTKFNGIEVYDSKIENFNLIRDVDGMSNSFVKTIAEDPGGNVWIGTIMGGINIIEKDSENIRIIRNENNDPQSLIFDRVDYIYKDREGMMWVGTFRGLDQYNQSTRTFKHIIPNRILFLYEDSHNIFWVSTIDGLYTLDKKTGKTSHLKSDHYFFQSSSTRVNKIIEDYKGNLWFGTNQEGLYRYDVPEDNLINYKYISNDSTSLSANMVRALCEDQDKNLWIGTKSNGLNKYDRKSDRFTRYPDLEEIANISIFSIVDDENGNLWMGTSDGLKKFNPLRNTIYGFNSKQGIQGNVFELNARLKDSENRLLFGGKDGINIFYPDKIYEPATTYDMVITDVLLYNKSIANDVFKFGEINLKHNENFLSFEFSTLDYSGVESYKYYYKLENFDEDWIYSGEKNFASYTNIPPGDYTFKVTHDNPYKDQRINLLMYQVSISKPYWKQFWFRSLIVFLILGTGYLFYLARFSALKIKQGELEKLVSERTNELKHANKELQEHRNNLEKIVADRTKDLTAAMIKAEESDRLKSAFLANLSHEIRTPLNAIIGFSAILTQEGEDEQSKEEIFRIINNNSRSLLSIINDIVDFSMIEAGQIKIQKEIFFLSDLLHEIYLQHSEELKRTIDSKTKELEIKIDKAALENKIVINTDPYKLRQIFNNLINNAIKFTEKGEINIGYEIVNSEIKFCVSDTGIGIKEENINTIFERFWKEDNNDVAIYRGTGLGLSITKHLLEMMGGKIHVVSQRGIGSQFYFTLPIGNNIKIKPQKKKQSSYESDPNWGGRLFLVVEDIDSNYAILEKILQKTGASLIRAKDGREAVEKFTSFDKFDIVLMDIKLPVMDGKEATKEIKKHDKNIPVIAQTAYALSSEEREIKETGFDGYISKPFISERIIQTISMFL